MRVLITGGAGFIGSHLAETLLGRGDSIVVVDDLSTGSIENIRHMLSRPGFEFVRGSVRDQTIMTLLIGRCDTIYHLAAAVGVQLIVDRPVHTIETNIHGTEVVLSLANTFRRRILLASTSEVYGLSPSVESGPRLVSAVLMETDEQWLTGKRCLNMKKEMND